MHRYRTVQKNHITIGEGDDSIVVTMARTALVKSNDELAKLDCGCVCDTYSEAAPEGAPVVEDVKTTFDFHGKKGLITSIQFNKGYSLAFGELEVWSAQALPVNAVVKLTEIPSPPQQALFDEKGDPGNPTGSSSETPSAESDANPDDVPGREPPEPKEAQTKVGKPEGDLMEMTWPKHKTLPKVGKVIDVGDDKRRVVSVKKEDYLVVHGPVEDKE